MPRIAFTMQVNPARHDEYIKRHSPIWGELEQALRAHGVIHYSIFLDPRTNMLFAYAEVESVAQWQSLAATPVCQRWCEFMSDIMPMSPEGIPISSELTETFHWARSPLQ